MWSGSGQVSPRHLNFEIKAGSDPRPSVYNERPRERLDSLLGDDYLGNA